MWLQLILECCGALSSPTSGLRKGQTPLAGHLPALGHPQPQLTQEMLLFILIIGLRFDF